MKWTMKLVAEVVPGKPIEHEIATIERAVDDSGGQDHSGEPTEGNRHCPGSSARHQRSILPAVWKRVSHEGLLPGHASFGVRERWHAYPAVEGMFLLGIAGAQLRRAFHEQEPHHTGIAISHSQDGCVVAVWKGG